MTTIIHCEKTWFLSTHGDVVMKITKIAAIKVSALVVCNVVSVVAPHDAIAPAVNVLVWGSIEICINNRKPKDEK